MKCLNIDELSVEQKIGQLIVVRKFLDEDDKKFVMEMLEKRCVGGVQVPCTEGCEKITAEIKSHADYPVLICADMEKGFPISKYKIPSKMSLGITGDEELAYQVGAVTAIEAKKHGYNTLWGPVVDMVKQNAMCKIPRVLGSVSNVDTVSKMAAAVLRGYYDNGMIASAKHWPSPTDGKLDGHVFKGTSQLTEQDISDTIIKPYLYAMENAGLKAVMSGHAMYPNIDDTYPSSLSEKIIGILRKAGFDGLIFTDSFAMIGILQRFGEDACLGLAIKAGNDMVLPNYRVPFKTSYEQLLNAYKNGVFSEERLNEAVRRVIEAQNFTLTPATATEVSEYQKECFTRVEKDGICAIKDEGVSLKLDENKKKLFVVTTENLYRNEDGVPYEIGDNCGINESNIDAVKQSILKRFPDSEIQVINQFPSRTQIEVVCNAAVKADEVVYITYSSSGSYRIGENLTEQVENLMLSMDYRIAAVIHLGNPYAMERIVHVPRLILSVGGKENSVDHAVGVLAGEYEPKGKLPLDIKFN